MAFSSRHQKVVTRLPTAIPNKSGQFPAPQCNRDSIATFGKVAVQKVEGSIKDETKAVVTHPHPRGVSKLSSIIDTSPLLLEGPSSRHCPINPADIQCIVTSQGLVMEEMGGLSSTESSCRSFRPFLYAVLFPISLRLDKKTHSLHRCRTGCPTH